MGLPQDAVGLIVGLVILVGAIQCFFGYRIFKFVLAITGFLIGGVFAGAAGYALSQQPIVALLAGLVGGLIGALLMVAIYFVGVFLIGAILGGVLGIMLYTAAGSSPEPAVLVILAVIGGIIALVLQKFMIIVSTAFGGAWGVVAGIAYFTTGVIDPTGFDRLARSGGAHLFVIVLCWLVLGIVGVIVQYRSTPAKQKQVQPSASPNT